MNLKLLDSSGLTEWTTLSPPLGESTIEGAVDIKTLDNNISTYFTSNKRQWTHTWPYMSEDKYLELRGYYDRQFTEFKFPLLSLDFYSIDSVPVRMYMEQKDIIDGCGTVENVTITLRETRQLA